MTTQQLCVGIIVAGWLTTSFDKVAADENFFGYVSGAETLPWVRTKRTCD